MQLLRSGWTAAVLALGAAGQSGDALQVIQEGALRSRSYSWLRELTDSIGPRLTASSGMQQAASWAAALMSRIGLEDVHLEPWQLRSGWKRGRADVELITHPRIPLNVTSYGWTGSTPTDGIEADVVEVHREAIADELPRAAGWTGKVVFVTTRGSKEVNNPTFYSQLVKLVATADRIHAAAVIARDLRPGLMLTHTGPVTFGSDTTYEIPVLDITGEHQKLIERLLEDRRLVRLHLNVQNRFVPGPVQATNVSGEIRGREHPEDIIVLGAHLDSWDLGTGAIDDGTGVAAILGAAQAIKSSGRRPRRTIRVVLFTGEEQGLLGSRAWLKAHEAEVPKLVCALVLDWGQGPITALPLAGHEELKKDLTPLVEFLNGIQKFRLADGFLTFTDGYAFTLAGVPGLAFYQESPEYSLVGHSAADTYDKVDAEGLARNTATIAIAGFWIADLPNRIGTTWPREEIPRRLTELKQSAMLETLGLWPFEQNPAL